MQPTTISIATQKGGVGKTTLTSMIAAQMHYVHELRCLAVDADFPQNSLSLLREREEKTLVEKPALQDQCNNFFSKRNFGIYPIFRIDEDHYKTMSDLLAAIPTAGLQAILVDLPGSVNQMEVLHTLLDIEYFFVPMTPDRVVIESTLSFNFLLNSIKEKFPDRCKLKEIRYFLTQVDSRTNGLDIIDQYKPTFQAAGMRFLETYIPRSLKFNKETLDHRTVYRSTLLPMTPAIASELHINSLTLEILEICQLQTK